jgi:hypothetical protein
MEEFGIAEGDLGITKITTKTDLFGFNNINGLYVDENGGTIGGYFYSDDRSIHISPYALKNMADFKAIAGRELIHAYHCYLYGVNFNLVSTEKIAYMYTYNTYLQYNCYDKAMSFYSYMQNNILFKLPSPEYNFPYINKL